MAKGKKGKKRRSKKKGGGVNPFAYTGSTVRRGRHPTAKAKQAYYKNVRKAYGRLKKVAEAHGFA